MRLFFPTRLMVLAALAVVAIPELAKRFKPAAKAVGKGFVDFGEAIMDAAKDEPAKPAANSAAAPPTAPPKAEKAKPAPKKAAPKPKPVAKPRAVRPKAAAKSRAPRARKKAAEKPAE